MNVITAERDAILAEGASFTFVTNDSGRTYNVCDAVIAGERFVVSPRTGMIARMVQTGRTVRRGGRWAGMVRVRLDYAVDAERADSSVVFGTGEHSGGWAPAYVFGM